MGKVYQFKTATDGIIDVVSQIQDGLITGPKLVNNIILPSDTTIAGAASIATQSDIDIINQGMLPHAAVQTVINTATLANFGGTSKGSWSTSGNYPAPNDTIANAGKITLDNVSINSALDAGDTTTLAVGDRVLIRFTDVGSAKYSGLYFVQVVGVDSSESAVLYRALDFNSNAELVIGAYVNVVSTNSPDANNAYFLQSKGGDLNSGALTFALWGTNTVTLTAGQGIDITGSTISAKLAAGGPLSFDMGGIQLDFADPLEVNGSNELTVKAATHNQAGYMSSADFDKLAAMGDSITQSPALSLQTIGTTTPDDFALPLQDDNTVAVYQIRLLAKSSGNYVVQTIEFATACDGSGVVSQLDSNPSGTIVTEYHSDNSFKNVPADFLSGGSGGLASLHLAGLADLTIDYSVTCVRQVY